MNNHPRINVKFFFDTEKYEPFDKSIELLKYGSEFSSGCDLRSAVDITIPSKGPTATIVPTGLRFEIENPRGVEAQIRPRSGMSVKNPMIEIKFGTIDSDYRGDIGVIVFNHGDTHFEVKRGDRIAQLVFAPVLAANIMMVSTEDQLSPTGRGVGGFGSTGTN